MLLIQNNACNTHKYVLALSLFACSMGLASTAAIAADASGSYKQERAACLSGQTQQDRATCLKEAGAARGEAKRGNLTESPISSQNAQTRCNVLPPADRDDCIRRIQGEGTVSGSVDGGGVLRETRTIVPAPQPAGSEYQPAPVMSPQY